MNRQCISCNYVIPSSDSHTKCHRCRRKEQICTNCGKNHNSIIKLCMKCAAEKNTIDACPKCNGRKTKISDLCRKCTPSRVRPLVDGKKMCHTCKMYLDLDKYHKYHKGPHGLEYNCKECDKVYLDKLKVTETWKASRAKTNDKVKIKRNDRRKKLYDYLEGKCCTDCGETNILTLEFDHVRGIKVGNVSSLIGNKPWETVLKEIAKCDIRCSSCHSIRTAKSRNYAKYLMMKED